jgi:uncharacterized peroxidase-related enzyme
MDRVAPLPFEDLLPEARELLEVTRQRMGFLPTSQLVMARKPKLLEAFIGLTRAVYDPAASIPLELRNMIAFAASTTVQSNYCMAHTGNNTVRSGVPEEKLQAIFDLDNSAAFTAAERAALRLAKHAAAVPNQATDADFAEARKYYSDDEIVEIMAVICMFGFLNRWNDTMASGLEAAPQELAERLLAPLGWDGTKHTTEAAE